MTSSTTRREATPMTSKLNLDQGAVLLARELARRAGDPVTQLALTHTTVSIERAVLRLGGLDGADARDAVGEPADRRGAGVGRARDGVALPVWDALRAGGYPDLPTLAEAAAASQVGSACRLAGQRRWRGTHGPFDIGRGVRPRRAAGPAGPADRRPRRPAVPLGVPDRRGGRHRPGHRAGAGGGRRRRRRDRGDPVDRAGAPRLRSRGRRLPGPAGSYATGRASGGCARPSTRPRASSAGTCG